MSRDLLLFGWILAIVGMVMIFKVYTNIKTRRLKNRIKQFKAAMANKPGYTVVPIHHNKNCDTLEKRTRFSQVSPGIGNRKTDV
jgi:hypothetical protein